MRPTIAFPREDDLTSRAPKQLIVRDDIVKDTAAASFGAPDFAPLASRRISNSNGPRLAIAPRAEGHATFRNGNTEESDLPAIGRPGRLQVRVYARVQIDDGLGGRVISADEGVVASAADKREFRTIRRPAQFAGLAVSVDQLLRFRTGV